MSESRAYKGDLPGSARGPCLGCGGRVVLARHAHVRIAGKRDGSVLIMLDARPLVLLATDLNRILEPDQFLLGVSHRDCVDLARKRLEAGEVNLPAELPRAVTEEVIGDDELPALHLPPDGKACPFCGATDTSDEHVIPRWLQAELTNQSRRPEGAFVVSTPYGPQRRRTIEITVPVCTSCNERWLSVLENDTKPILSPLVLGVPTAVLSPYEQRLVAAWAVKTALMFDLAGGSPIIPLGFYYDFRQQRCALSSQVVWLGAYRESKRAIWASVKAFPEDGEPASAFVATFTAFRALFQVFGHFTRGRVTLTDRRPFTAGLLQIAPEQSASVKWPANNLAFGDDRLDELADSITESRA